MSFAGLWDAIADVGRDPRTGGYRRFAWTDADLVLREWFRGEAAARGMDVVEDGNGNQVAWWGDAAAGDALLLGSHLDSVPDGGAFDGPLGVVASFAAIDRLREDGFVPTRPIAVASFADEEGARYGIACTGSRLATGTLDPDRALALRDRDGESLAERLVKLGRDPEALGPSADLLAAVGTFVELHVEQGRALVDVDAPVGVATAIWPHGRWRLDFTGRADHAGTTTMADRRDPMLTHAMTVLAANKQARLRDARATVGRVEVEPNATNGIASRVTAWLDARAADEPTLAGLVAAITQQARERAERDGTAVEVVAESESPLVELDGPLRTRLAGALGDVPVLPTGAGHDAGVLSAAGVPTAMLFVRNPSGVSHSPDEHAEEADCLAGVDALVAVITDLAGTRP